MRILVTGGHGQVGSAIAALGREQSLDLVALGRAELDITDAASIRAAFETYKPSVLINAAAYTEVEKADCEQALAHAVNEVAAGLLAEACATADIPFLHISTDYVFDGSKDGLYDERDSVNPICFYAKSKEAGERALRAITKRHIILRTSWVFGVQGSNFVKTIVRLAKDRVRLTVVADQMGGPSSARSIAAALLAIVAVYGRGGDIKWGTYHYCQKPYVSWYEFACVIVERATEMGLINHNVKVLPITSEELSSRIVRPANSKLETKKFESEFGILLPDWSGCIDAVIRSTD